MYSMQHVLWRGAMALSLLVVGGVGAGVSTPTALQSEAVACREDATAAFDGVNATMRPAIVDLQVATNAKPMVTLETITIHAIHPDA